MTEVAVDIPVNLEKIEPKFGIRRNSTGSLGIETSETKILPHYLLRSTGSCHDICKYGVKRDPETKAKIFISKTSASPAEAVDLQKKKKSFGTSKPPLDSTSRTTNQSTRKEILSSSKKIVSATNSSQSKLRPLKVKESSSSTGKPLSRRRFSDSVIPKRSGEFEVNPRGGTLSRRNSDTKLVNDKGSKKVSKKKFPVPPAESPSTKSSSKRVVLKKQSSLIKSKTKQAGDQTVLEKTLYMVEPEAESQVTRIVQGTSLGNDSLLCQSPSFKERDFQDRSPWRGEEIDIHCQKSSSRRPEFRPGNVLAENQNGNIDSREKSLKQVEANGELNEAGNKYVEVNLRHQDAQERKDSQNLLNNVIEETASKLVKTRMGRVKALVDAFETVISLQDIKFLQTTRR